MYARWFIALGIVVILTGCATSKAPPRSPCDNAGGKRAGDVVEYLNHKLSQIAIFPAGGGIEDGAEVKDPESIKQVQEALVGATVVEASEMQGTPDVIMILWTESPSAKWAVEWLSGSHFVRLIHDGNQGQPITLRMNDECVPALAQVVNRALAGTCEVSAVAHPYPDIATGRQATSVLFVDGGGTWKAGELRKVLWRIVGKESTHITITFRRSDGSTLSDLKLQGAVMSPGQPVVVQDFPSNLAIPQPGCWTMAMKSDSSLGPITIKVR